MCTIEIREIVLDAVKYPAEDWMKVIILGFLTLLSFIGILTEINIFTLLFLILLPLPLGYLFKIIKSSFKGFDKLLTLITEIYVHRWSQANFSPLIYAIPIVAVFVLQLWCYSTLTFQVFLYLLFSWLLGSTLQIILFLLIGLLNILVYIMACMMVKSAQHSGSGDSKKNFHDWVEKYSVFYAKMGSWVFCSFNFHSYAISVDSITVIPF